MADEAAGWWLARERWDQTRQSSLRHDGQQPWQASAWRPSRHVQALLSSAGGEQAHGLRAAFSPVRFEWRWRRSYGCAWRACRVSREGNCLWPWLRGGEGSGRGLWERSREGKLKTDPKWQEMGVLTSGAGQRSQMGLQDRDSESTEKQEGLLARRKRGERKHT